MHKDTIQDEAHALQVAITELLKDFTRKTGLFVTDVSVDLAEVYTANGLEYVYHSPVTLHIELKQGSPIRRAKDYLLEVEDD